MDESRPDQSLEKGIKPRNELGRGKEETKLRVRTGNHPKYNKETHGLRDDIDANTPISDIKGPNVFERVKEEFEAIVGAIHTSKEDKSQDSPSSVERGDLTLTGAKHEKQTSSADKGIKAPNSLERGKEDTETVVNNKKHPTYNKETHGLRDDIDVSTPLSDIKGPNVFERVKEELEALVDTLHQNKEDKNQDSPSSARRSNATFTKWKHVKQSSLSEEHTSRPGKIKTGKVDVKTETSKEKSPASEFKGPSIFHRAKEEIEAIVDTINAKKESDSDTASPKEGGFRASISKKVNKIKNRNQD